MNTRRRAADFLTEERQRLIEAVKHHQRDRNRAPSEPAGEYTSSRTAEHRLINTLQSFSRPYDQPYEREWQH
jgi:hypothetical protein